MDRRSLLMLVATAALAGCQQQKNALSPAALPVDVVITAPDPGAPPSAARFSGI